MTGIVEDLVNPLLEPVNEASDLLPLGLGEVVRAVTRVVVEVVSALATTVDTVVALPGALLPGLGDAVTEPMPLRPPVRWPLGEEPSDPAPPAAPSGPSAPAVDSPYVTAGPGCLQSPVQSSGDRVSRHPGAARSAASGGNRPPLPPDSPAISVPGAGACRGGENSGPEPPSGVHGRDRWTPAREPTGVIRPEARHGRGRTPLARHVPG